MMENKDMFEKLKGYAENGKGRRLLNALNMRGNTLTSFELDEVLKIYREIGLLKEVEILKQRRGILRDDQYDDLAEAVRGNCCSEKYDDFTVSLRNLLTSGIKMNPANMKETPHGPAQPAAE